MLTDLYVDFKMLQNQNQIRGIYSVDLYRTEFAIIFGKQCFAVQPNDTA